MKSTKHWWWGKNSLWAKFCKKIGKYPAWVHSRAVYKSICSEWNIYAIFKEPGEYRIATDACVKAGTAQLVEFKELGYVPTESCPIEHRITKSYAVCADTGLKTSPYCKKAKLLPFTEEEWAALPTCSTHKAPPPPHPKLPRDARYLVCKKLVMSSLTPSMYINPRITLKSIKYFFDAMAKGVFGNAVRVFAWGGWEWRWFKRGNLIFPFQYSKGGVKFDLTKPNTNLDVRLKQCLDIAAERGITTFLTLLDNCSIHQKSPGWWGSCFWNGENNINDTATEKYLMTHWYEDKHQDKPGGPKLGEFLMAFYRRMFKLFEGYRPFLGFEALNEGDGRTDYHKLLALEAKKFGIDEQFRITSMLHDHFYKSRVFDLWNYSLHKSGSKASFEERLQVVNSEARVIASGDGPLPPTSEFQIQEDARYLLFHPRCMGAEWNFRPFFRLVKGKWVAVGGKESWDLANLPYWAFDAIGRGFKAWLNR